MHKEREKAQMEAHIDGSPQSPACCYQNDMDASRSSLSGRTAVYEYRILSFYTSILYFQIITLRPLEAPVNCKTCVCRTTQSFGLLE